MNLDTLPSGARFAFWEDATEYQTVYHVAQRHPAASDENSGTKDAPLLTINAAARLLQPGEKVIVHEGIYRECVRPARGGTGADRMIAYEAAPGERVVVRGSEAWTPAVQPSVGYGIAKGATVWMADLPAECGADGYNPFLVRNAYQYMTVYANVTDSKFLERALLRRGTVFADGIPLKQVHFARELASGDGVFWVEEPGRRIHFRLPGDDDPAGHTLEVSAREQVFAPEVFGLGYIRVIGFIFEHAADGLPVPQRAAVSTMRGHHWIIEGNTIAWVNAVGMDIGAQTWDATIPQPTGHHIVRNNTIRHCGICGLAGALGVHHTLVEKNTFEYIGGLNLERMWECGGIKLHLAEHSLIRHNIFRRLHHAGGIWLDCSNINNRITDNVFTDIESLCGGVYMEMTYDLNVIDHNVFWDIRDAEHNADGSGCGGAAVRADCNETLVVAHNFFGNVEGHAVMFSLNQSDRRHDGRTGLCRANAAYNNVFYRCPHRIHLGRREENRCDGNLFDIAQDAFSFQIAHPAPGCFQNLAGWQRFFALDAHSTQAKVTVEFDVDTCQLHWEAEGPLPEMQAVVELPEEEQGQVPGPFRCVEEAVDLKS
ncbi:MAG: right-handed parallel beta-helix repeat-containing protein [Armatimonadota bacterium]